MTVPKDFKIIWRYLNPHKKRVYFVSLIAVIGSVIAATIPYIYGRLVDAAISDYSQFYLIISILVIWLLLSFIDNWLSRYVHSKGSMIAIDVMNDVYLEGGSHLLELPLGFHKHKKMGRIMRQVDRGATFLNMILNEIIFYILPQFITVIVILAIVFLIEWRLAMLLIITLLFYTAATIWKTQPIIKSHKKLNKVYEKAFGDYFDSINNVQTVKSFTQEDLEKIKIKNNFFKKGGNIQKEFILTWRNLQAWQQTIFDIGFVGIFGTAVLFLSTNIISVGQFVMFIGYISLAYSPFGQLAQNYRMFQSGMTSLQRYLSVLKKKPELYKSKKMNLANIKGAITFENICFSYDKGKNVLIDIDFKVKAGEIVALVGESGVGKSTLIDLISGYYKPTKGRILIDGHDAQEVTIESIRRNIALVPQEVTLFNDSIKKNISYGKLDATDDEIKEAAKAAHAHQFIQKFPKKYSQIVGERGIKLSTGQKQRIAIARAVLRNPRILILDEATSSLDSATEKHVQTALDVLMKGRTTFIIAHRLSTIQKADQIVVLEKGKIVEIGDHQELINKGGVYHKLSKLQATYIK